MWNGCTRNENKIDNRTNAERKWMELYSSLSHTRTHNHLTYGVKMIQRNNIWKTTCGNKCVCWFFFLLLLLRFRWFIQCFVLAKFRMTHSSAPSLYSLSAQQSSWTGRFLSMTTLHLRKTSRAQISACMYVCVSLVCCLFIKWLSSIPCHGCVYLCVSCDYWYNTLNCLSFSVRSRKFNENVLKEVFMLMRFFFSFFSSLNFSLFSALYWALDDQPFVLSHKTQ